jgi:L-2-hydroxyglutarate oxidase LhgO
MIGGGVECGPNAVLAFAREGYRKRDVNLYDLAETLTYRGFLRLAWKYWRVGLGEMHRSFSKAAFVRALQRLMPEIRAEHLVNGLIYPVPDPAFPFLGVHFTRMIGGGVECGPNAVLAFAREGYFKTSVNLRDLLESLTYPGFLRLAAKYWRTGAGEMWRSLSKHAFVKALKRLVPEIHDDQLVPSPAGVRAQALSRDGSMVDDFLIEEHGRVINVLNAPSPAATSSLNIGHSIVDRVAARMAETECRT